MSFVESIQTCLSKIVTFEGRARRSEYWYFSLFVFIISGVINLIFKGGLVPTILSILLSICSLSAEVRRLHDVGKSGWWLLLAAVPIIGWIILIVFMVKDSEAGENQYGPNPKAASVDM